MLLLIGKKSSMRMACLRRAAAALRGGGLRQYAGAAAPGASVAPMSGPASAPPPAPPAPPLPHMRPSARASALSRLAELAAHLPIDIPPAPTGSPKPVVAVGLSGGVDSALTAALYTQRGYDVMPVFMRNWDAREEGGGACDSERDREDAAQVAAALGLRLLEADFVRHYWQDVFSELIGGFEQGLTPNPDLACNRHIKFGALLTWARERGAELVATGHYARLGWDSAGRRTLLRGLDRHKDQSYFLASVGCEALARAAFPLGALTKPQVRALAAATGLPTASKRSSRGICFVGKRDFGDFIGQYVRMTPGPMIDVESGVIKGTHRGLAAYTIGQGARLSGQLDPWFVVGKDAEKGALLVARGGEHPALSCDGTSVARTFWVAGQPPEGLARGGVLAEGLAYKARYGQQPEPCIAAWADADSAEAAAAGVGAVAATTPGGPLAPSRLWRPVAASASGSAAPPPPVLHVRFVGAPARAVTPEQALVLYAGEVCLGGGLVSHPGRSHYERDAAPAQSGAS